MTNQVGGRPFNIHRVPTTGEALAGQVVRFSYTDNRKARDYYQELLEVVEKCQEEAHRLVAQAFALRAKHEPSWVQRSRLFKWARRYASVHAVAAAFEAMGLKLIDAHFRGDLSRSVTVTQQDYNVLFDAERARWFPRETVTA